MRPHRGKETNSSKLAFSSSSVEEEDEEKFHITGFAYDNAIVSAYIENLQKTNRFVEINLLFSEKAENSKFKKFSLTCFFQKLKNS